MKRILVFLFVLCVYSVVSAHPPSNIEAGYNHQKKVLDINITHQVYDPGTHYIKRVTISRNGKEVISENFLRQQDAHGRELSYVLFNLVKGDRITVKCFCGVFGDSEETIIISE